MQDKAVYALSHDEMFSIHPVTSADEDDTPANEVKAVEFGDLRPVLKAEYVVQVLVDAAGSYVASGRTRWVPSPTTSVLSRPC